MDYDHGFLRDQAKREFHIERLVNDSWLVSVHPRTGETYTPFMAFSNACDLMAALATITGKKPGEA